MRYIGVDLAWSETGRGLTGLCMAESGSVVDSILVKTDREIVEWLGPRCGEACVVAVDAPVVVRNPPRTTRGCEKLINACFQRYEAGCHPSNTGRPYFANGTRAERLAAGLGLELDPALPPAGAFRREIEVYPHPAQVVLFGLDRTLKYKRGKARSMGERRAAFGVYLGHMEQLRTADPPLDVGTGPRWAALTDALMTTGVQTEMDRLEDELDAYFCAYVAMYYERHRLDRCRIVGDLETGYIVTPVTEAIGATLDQLVLRQVSSPEPPASAPRPTYSPVQPTSRAAGPDRWQGAPLSRVLCACGCGEPVRRRYLPGHDARHKEALIRRALGGDQNAEIILEQLGWTKFLDSRRS